MVLNIEGYLSFVTRRLTLFFRFICYVTPSLYHLYQKVHTLYEIWVVCREIFTDNIAYNFLKSIMIILVSLILHILNYGWNVYINVFVLFLLNFFIFYEWSFIVMISHDIDFCSGVFFILQSHLLHECVFFTWFCGWPH